MSEWNSAIILNSVVGVLIACGYQHHLTFHAYVNLWDKIYFIILLVSKQLSIHETDQSKLFKLDLYFENLKNSDLFSISC